MEALQRALGDDYILERELGRGGMGTVYLARDARLHRPVALKVLSPELSGDAGLRERFVRETRVAASFSHPNIVPVHAIEERGDLLAFVMGYVEGETLTERVRRGPVSVPDAVRIIQEVAWALSYAHGRGIVHRDVKPDNILIERTSGRAMVTDFGIARAVTAAPGTGLTRVGEVVGTPEFMSPEQAAGDVVDGRSDLYSLGIVGFYALTGRLPFTADNPTALLAMHLTQPPPPLLARRGDVPDEFAQAIDRCLAKAPEDRWLSGESLASALDTLRRAAPDVPAPVRIFLHRFNSGVVVSLLMFVVAYSFASPGTTAPTMDRLIVVAFMVACGFGIAMAAVRRVRGVLQQGFRYHDVVAATATVIAEDRAARDAVRASAAEMKRRRLNRRLAVFSMMWPVAMFYWIHTTVRRPVPGHPGMYSLSLPGVVSAFAAAVAFGLGLALLVSDPLKRTPWLRIQAALWQGPIGRGLFRLYGIGAAKTSGAVRMPATGAGPRTVLNALPKALRQQLRGAVDQISRLEAELDTLAQRKTALNGALAEVMSGPGTAVAADVRDGTAAEIRDHLAGTAARRDAIVTTLEQARIELVRVRAGLAPPAAVLQVLHPS
jgi:serine/threonine-protein kinase